MKSARPATGRVLNLNPAQMVSAMGISAARAFCPGAEKKMRELLMVLARHIE
jgi:hypothetical protein